MFTRRTLFKLLTVIGAGRLFSAAGEAGAARCSSIGAASCSGHSTRPGGPHPDVLVQALDVTAIEQWENLLDDLDGAELIGRYISLRPTGDASRDSRGRCPFCRHGAYSLLVDGRDNSYFCTECLAGGHALDFYARMEGLGLSESLHSVGKLMASGELQGKRPRQKRFQCIIDETNRFAREALVHSREGESALTWLDRQGVMPTTVEAFSLGLLSCAIGKQLLERLRTMGFSPDELEQAGIVRIPPHRSFWSSGPGTWCCLRKEAWNRLSTSARSIPANIMIAWRSF